MDADPNAWLFDPSTTRRLVLAHRSPADCAVGCVVSDVVWGDVVRLLRWARASTRQAGQLESGILWRLAAGCGDLLRRLPGLSAEIAEPWRRDDAAPLPGGVPAGRRIEVAADRLTALLRHPGPVQLWTLAAEIDALGEAAIGALAARVPWTTGGDT